MAASVKVAVRVRPFNKRELSMDSGSVVSVSGNQVFLQATAGGAGCGGNNNNAAKNPHKFAFDYAYWSHDVNDAHFVSQEQVYLDLGSSVVDNAFSGYNACVFAYGQTGSGKTYTMMGSEEDRGLIPRICCIFSNKVLWVGQEK